MTPNTEPTIAAILAAGGRGVRFGAGAPKQFLELKGIPIYVWSLSTLLSSKKVSRAVITAPSDLVATIEKQLGDHVSRLQGKPVCVVPGGDTRQKSVYLGLQKLNQDPVDYVLVHDAARPLLTGDLVERTIEGVIKYGACTLAIPCADTLKKVQGELLTDTVSRENLVQLQTPQASRFDWLLAAHRKCDAEGLATTDDTSVLEHDGHRVGIVHGASSNIKITQPDDLALANALASIVLADRL